MPEAVPMKIAVMGAGGLGAYYGGMLARAGAEVHFIARGKHLEAMRREGLTVESPHVGDFHFSSLSATDSPADLAAASGTMDVVLMGVKAYDLEEASQAITPLVGANTFVLPLLNGVDAAERIGAVLGMDRVVGGVVFMSANVIAPGKIRHVLEAPIIFGELSGGLSARCTALESAFSNAGLRVKQSESIRRELWHKYVLVSPMAAVSSAARLRTQAMVTRPDLRALYMEAAREVKAVARASGVDVDEDCVEQALGHVDSVGPRHTVSMLLDLWAGKRLELEAMVGAVVRLGAKHHVPTPVSQTLYHVLKPHENGPPEDLIQN